MLINFTIIDFFLSLKLIYYIIVGTILDQVQILVIE